MKVEIKFSGLCMFLNLEGKDPNIVGPSVILVQSDHGYEPRIGPPDHREHRHIPFIAFNTEKVKVDNATGFLPVGYGDESTSYLFMPLDGVELSIETDPPGKPYVSRNYYHL